MRKILLLLLLIPVFANAQTYVLNYDSVRIGKGVGSGVNIAGNIFIKNLSAGLLQVDAAGRLKNKTLTTTDVTNAESTANKVTDFTSPNDTKYPSVKLVNDSLLHKNNNLFGIQSATAARNNIGAEATANKTSTYSTSATNYPNWLGISTYIPLGTANQLLRVNTGATAYENFTAATFGATNTTLTVSGGGSYSPFTSKTIGINLSNSNVWLSTTAVSTSGTAIPFYLERTTASSNIGIEFRNPSGSWYAGQTSAGAYAIGIAAAINASPYFQLTTANGLKVQNATLTAVASGTAGTDSLLVKATDNTVKKISATYYSTGLTQVGSTTLKTANYTATTSDFTIRFDCTSGNLTNTLPAAASVTGRVYNIKKVDASINILTIDANGIETIDGALTLVITMQYGNVNIQSNGTSWDIL